MAAVISQQHEGGNAFQGLVDCLFFPEVYDEDMDSLYGEGQGLGAADASQEGIPTGRLSKREPRMATHKAKRPRLDDDESSGSSSSGNTDNESQGTNSDGMDSDGDNKEESRRERNRRHARETRLRKKEYVENLKAKLEAVSDEKDALAQEMHDKIHATDGKHAQWLKTVRGALALRASGEPNKDRWRQFVEEEVVLVHPITPYRSFKPGDVVSNRCVLMGIGDVIQDSASLLVALAALCKTGIHEAERKLKVQIRFSIDEESLHFSESGLMCPFEMRSVNLSALGLKSEVSKNGCLKAAFNEEGKIKQLELYFDPISFWRQMQAAAKSDVPRGTETLDDLLMTPNTLTQALADSNEARLVTEPDRPFRITHVNEAWTNLCGFTRDEAVGQTVASLGMQGDVTDMNTVAQLVDESEEHRATSMVVTNYDKLGAKFRNFLQVYPLTEDGQGDGEISHLLGVLKPIGAKF